MKRIVLGGLTAVGLVIGGLAVAAVPATAEAPPKVTICHAAGREGTTKFVTLTIPYNAAYGQAGHFFERGTPNSGHEADYEGQCEQPPTPIAVKVTYTDATCAAPGTVTPVEVPGQVEWTTLPNGGLQATALPGNVITGVSTFDPPEPQLSGEVACPTTTTATTATTAPPQEQSAPPDVTVAAAGPVPATAAPAATPAPAAAPAQALPTTGSATWATFLLGLAALLGGLGFVRLSRRPS